MEGVGLSKPRSSSNEATQASVPEETDRAPPGANTEPAGAPGRLGYSPSKREHFCGGDKLASSPLVRRAAPRLSCPTGRGCHGPTPTSDRNVNKGIPVKCPRDTLERDSASQDAKHFRGRDLMVRTSPEEKDIGRDTARSPTVGKEKQADPGGKQDAGPDRTLEDQQRNKMNREESPREKTRNPASVQEKDIGSSPATFQEERGSTSSRDIQRKADDRTKPGQLHLSLS
ncbi:hypothetical protein NDU88_006108 [Pleurodeles waltl]|uniref:Uncharacterized protein n=1 Tax=Pleurodeles waltl TaxID=8319 RepID=A0AAV7TW70_PLEWA|nr:hypothetical protein NDU88_006108 [Pleurodeles waltl]